jgi:hypothetical protein
MPALLNAEMVKRRKLSAETSFCKVSPPFQRLSDTADRAAMCSIIELIIDIKHVS